VTARAAWSPATVAPGTPGDQSGDPDADGAPSARLDPVRAGVVAATLQALATPSRLLILTRLRHAPCHVTRLASELGMEQSAVSHQLRLLRHLGLVTATREGRTTVYALHDNHVALLLDAAIHHSGHLGPQRDS
jgi:DNA-binding transcriptional ArsR family regulator